MDSSGQGLSAEQVMSKQEIKKSLDLIFKGIDGLKKAFPGRQFTIDGRLVGDIGEVIAASEYDIILHKKSKPGYDADTPDGRRVQIKATFKKHLTFTTVPDYYLGFKLYDNGTHEVIFNGPGKIIYNKYRHRKDIGKKLLSFPIDELKKLSVNVPLKQRIPKRKGNRNGN